MVKMNIKELKTYLKDMEENDLVYIEDRAGNLSLVETAYSEGDALIFTTDDD